MTVQELINHLGQFNPETQVMFSHYDHTDYLYKIDMNEENVYLDDPVCDDNLELAEELWNGDDDYIGPKVVVFELSFE
jgi:hypothetical protein